MAIRTRSRAGVVSITVLCVLGAVLATLAGCRSSSLDIPSRGSEDSKNMSLGRQGAGADVPVESAPVGGSVGSSFEADIDADTGAGVAVASAAEATSRKLVFTGRMALEVKDPVASADEITRWVTEKKGFVEGSSVSNASTGTSISMVVRVPSAAFDETREHLRKLADSVLGDDKNREDVTGRYADMDARLANLKAAESELREMLAQAREQGGTTEDVLRIYNEVTRIRGEVDSLQAQLTALSEQVALSTLNVHLVSVAGVPSIGGGKWRPGITLRRAWSDLVGGMQNLGDIGIYLVVAVLPQLLILGVVLWALYRLFRRVRPRRARPSPGEQVGPPS
jgi:hypothetical protein